MGQAIMRLAAEREDVAIASVWVRPGQEPPEGAGRALASDDLDAVARAADVVIDFSLPDAVAAVSTAAVATGKPLVCGVSGLDDAGLDALHAAGASIPVVYDRNMSEGITALAAIVRELAGALSDGFSVAIDETHHAGKRDAPSGTALKLGAAIAAARGLPEDAIRYHSERRGEVPGDHTVLFESPTERLTLAHSVTTRDVFAAGALRAAQFARRREPGFYTMHDVIFGASR